MIEREKNDVKYNENEVFVLVSAQTQSDFQLVSRLSLLRSNEFIAVDDDDDVDVCK